MLPLRCRRRLRAVERAVAAAAPASAEGSRTEGSPARWDEELGAWRPKSPDDPESDEEDEVSPSGRLPEPELCLDILGVTDPWFCEEVKGVFSQMVSVWGVPIYATAGVPAAKLSHAANVLAQ